MTDEKIIPNSNDVLMGRGGTNNKHVGNENFRILAQRRSIQYASSSKQNKTQIHASLLLDVFNMRPPGRFIRKDRKSKEWIKVDIHEAFEKASRTLRDAVSQSYTTSTSNNEHVTTSRFIGRDQPFKNLVLLGGASPSSVSSGAPRPRKRKKSDVTSSTTSIMSLSTSRRKRQREVSPSSLQHTSSFLPTMHPLHRHQKTHDDMYCSNSITQQSDKLRPFFLMHPESNKRHNGGLVRRDGDHGSQRQVSLSKLHRGDTTSCTCCESFTIDTETHCHDSVVSTKTTDPRCVAAVIPSTAKTLRNPLFLSPSQHPAFLTLSLNLDSLQNKLQQHHNLILKHQPDESSYCGWSNNVNLSMNPSTTSLRDLQKHDEIKPQSLSINIMKEGEGMVAFNAASKKKTNDSIMSIEEEWEGLDPATYTTLMTLFSND